MFPIYSFTRPVCRLRFLRASLLPEKPLAHKLYSKNRDLPSRETPQRYIKTNSSPLLPPLCARPLALFLHRFGCVARTIVATNKLGSCNPCTKLRLNALISAPTTQDASQAATNALL